MSWIFPSFPGSAYDVAEQYRRLLKDIDKTADKWINDYPWVTTGIAGGPMALSLKSENKNEYLLATEMPGASVDDVDVEFENKTVKVTWNKKPLKLPADFEQKDNATYKLSFTNTFSNKIESVEATLEDGLLWLRCKKAAVVKPNSVKVKVK